MNGDKKQIKEIKDHDYIIKGTMIFSHCITIEDETRSY